MAEIVISRRARDDFKRIWHYIALDNEQAADRVLLAIDAKIKRLRAFPEIGAVRNDIRSNTRILVHGSYLVLYEYHRERGIIEVVAVVEGMRDLGEAF